MKKPLWKEHLLIFLKGEPNGKEHIIEEWKRTSCVLCGNQCGIEVRVENNKIVRVRGDQDNPISKGYVC